MIMQCPDYNDDDFEFSTAPVGSNELSPVPLDLPGFLYRGVPQDHRRRTLRMDAIRLPATGPHAAGTHPTIPGPRWLETRHVTRECDVAELFFG